jgi:ParB family transcriptional regulator, chromosome partitioning protein
MSTLAQSHSVTAIPLSKLVPWGGNVRRTGASDGIAELKASIAAHGILQSLVVRKTNRGKYAVVAGGRRYLALSELARDGAITSEEPVPCQVISRSIDAKEISLSENVIRAPMHPADQFEAFRDLIEAGATPAEVAARFGIAEGAVLKRLRLARVSPVVFEAYRRGNLSLEQVQAFAVSDDRDAQEQVFANLSEWNDQPDTIRRSLTESDIPGTDKRARFVTLSAYEQAGGALRRDLFTEGDEGAYLLDTPLLDRLVSEKLQVIAAEVAAEGWKWVDAVPDLDYEMRAELRVCRPEPLPLSDEAQAECKALSEEYRVLFESLEEDDEETSGRLDAIERRIEELEDTECTYTPDVLAIGGAIVTIGHGGEAEIVRGLVRPEDEPEDARSNSLTSPGTRPEFSAALVESLTEFRSAAIAASLAERPDIALAAVVHTLASGVFGAFSGDTCLRLAGQVTRLREQSGGQETLTDMREQWSEILPGNSGKLWEWCLSQDNETLLRLLAYCAAVTVNAVQTKADRPDTSRLEHAGKLAKALTVDMSAWFTPTADNFFGRVSRDSIVKAIAEATGAPAKRSWQKLKKAELAALAERECAKTGWLPEPLRS